MAGSACEFPLYISSTGPTTEDPLYESVTVASSGDEKILVEICLHSFQPSDNLVCRIGPGACSSRFS